jgi:hypothetical protein
MVDIGHVIMLLIILTLICLCLAVVKSRMDHYEGEICLPVTPMMYDNLQSRFKNQEKGGIPYCATADPLGADEYSKKLTPINCQVSEWTAETECQATSCNQPGTHTWSRKIIKKAEHGGIPCPLILSERRQCISKPCTNTPTDLSTINKLNKTIHTTPVSGS